MKKSTTLILFFVFTTLGTLIHEYGHVVGGYLIGYKTVLHYDRTSINKVAFITSRSYIWFIAAGIITTIGIGCLALAALMVIQKKSNHFIQTALIMFSLFWSREVFVLLRDLIIKPYIFPGSNLSDEQKLSLFWGIGRNTLSILLGITGIGICCYIIWRFIPENERLTFIFFGVTGFFLGYIFWYRMLGPWVLP